ncbi:MAG: SIS domain-containing protein [Acidimicrobiia bacterium]
MSAIDRRRGDSDVQAGLLASRRAIDCVVEAVAALSDRVGATRPVIELVLATTGKVVVTGLGKSGLVGAKFAATLSSTGTGASFVHAADALHGDAGAVGADDLVIAISNSGETPEVCWFAEMLRKRGVPIVAMTGCGGSSTLARLADVVVDVAVTREADPYDLLPTCSTVAASVVGDAIAIAAMVARGFGPEDFHRYHPGGALGHRLRSEP